MPRRYYSSTAVATTLSGSINNSTTSVTVTALSGFPNTTPWTALIDKDTASEEVVTVTAVAGTTLTVTRGVDGTSAVSHNAGAAFSHGVSARDFDEANSHVNDTTTDVHSQYVTKALLTAKADLVSATAASTPATLTVGANDTLLVADSAAATGLKWAALTASQVPNLDAAKVASGTLDAARIPTLEATKVPTQVQAAKTDSYTLVLSDAGKLIEMGKATAQTLTIPLDSSVAFPTGTKIDVIQTGAGETTIAGASGVTVNSEGSKLKINAQWQAVTLIKRATDTWVLIGAIKA